MAKRNSRVDGVVLIGAAFLTGVGLMIEWLMKNWIFAVGIATGIAAVIWVVRQGRKKEQEQRVAALLVKYGDQEVVDAIMRQSFWQGQTEAQLLDSLGVPAAVDKEVLKTKRRETWKYQESRKGQFRLRVTLENGVVTGWEQKG